MIMWVNVVWVDVKIRTGFSPSIPEPGTLSVFRL